MLAERIVVKNAGLVLISSYFTMLLERLELTSENKFVGKEAQLSAVHYLQYVATGFTYTEEHHLPLNKILCGVSPIEPVSNRIDVSEAQITLISGMLEAIINQWSAIGNSSIDGFRGNWLVRDGLLIEDINNWTLNVEKRAYDILINRSPFSFSIVKFPWMKKPLHVNWSY